MVMVVLEKIVVLQKDFDGGEKELTVVLGKEDWDGVCLKGKGCCSVVSIE